MSKKAYTIIATLMIVGLIVVMVGHWVATLGTLGWMIAIGLGLLIVGCIIVDNNNTIVIEIVEEEED